MALLVLSGLGDAQPSRFSIGLLHCQAPGMSLGVFLAKEYPAHKSSGLPCLFPDYAPASIGSCREVIIQSSDIELNGHQSNPAAPAPTFSNPVYTKIGSCQAACAADGGAPFSAGAAGDCA
jgi:hypothetical protein